MRSYDIIQDLYQTNRVFCSADYDRCAAYLCDILPFKKHRYTNGATLHNGWEIPPRWDVEEAYIRKNGQVILDATEHPLAVVALSAPFRGEVSLEELKAHLHTVGDRCENGEAIPFHFRQQYRPWARDWGFCVSTSFYHALEPGTYEVVIRTKESEGYLDVLEYTHQGVTEEMFVFVAHLDHPGMANDDLAGCAVGVELFERLRGRETKFSYRLVLLQEIIASEYYLQHLPEEERRLMLGALFLEMLGSDTPLALQHSMQEDALIEQALLGVLREKGIPHRTGPFRSIIGNDEIVWEAYGIPMPSLSRFPYPQYHTSDDNLQIISRDHLHTSVEVLDVLTKKLDEKRIIKKQFEGVPCTSNPQYDLYVDTFYEQYMSTDGASDQEKMALRSVMDYLPMIDHYEPVDALRSRFEVREERLLGYLRRWEDRNLITLL